jgi:hypothetical protein
MNANAVEHETQRIAASKALDMVQQRLQTYLGRGDEKVVRDTKGDRLLGVLEKIQGHRDMRAVGNVHEIRFLSALGAWCKLSNMAMSHVRACVILRVSSCVWLGILSG